MKLIHKVWFPKLELSFSQNQHSRKHRTQLNPISKYHKVIKKIKKKLHPIVIREWLRVCSTLILPTAGPFPMASKAMLMLFQLLTGVSDNYIPGTTKSTWHNISKAFWRLENLKKMDLWAEQWFSSFSNVTVRVAHSSLYNPELFKGVTLFVDGNDVRVTLVRVAEEKRRLKSGKSNLISHKLEFKNAAKQQLIMDSRSMTVGVSTSKGGNEIYDGAHMAEMFRSWGDEIEELFDPSYDVIIGDHHFRSNLVDWVSNNADRGYSLQNLCLPRRANEVSTPEEKEYREQFGSFRGKIESEKYAGFRV